MLKLVQSQESVSSDIQGFVSKMVFGALTVQSVSKCPFAGSVSTMFMRKAGQSLALYAERCPVMSRMLHSARACPSSLLRRDARPGESTVTVLDLPRPHTIKRSRLPFLPPSVSSTRIAWRSKFPQRSSWFLGRPTRGSERLPILEQGALASGAHKRS